MMRVTGACAVKCPSVVCVLAPEAPDVVPGHGDRLIRAAVTVTAIVTGFIDARAGDTGREAALRAARSEGARMRRRTR